MLVINERDMAWAPKPGSSLSLKNVLTDYRIGPGPLTGGVARWPRGKAGEAHVHPDQDELYIVLRGRGIARAGDALRELGPGDILHARAGEVHGMLEGLTEGGIELFYVLFPTEKGCDRP